jgi:prepilin-type processing-associated H-X9-DG protein/prepilin-type N-terminal cleavage/methylation domain-containing protein
MRHNRPLAPRTQRRESFTLVELLAVIAIIAILVGLLFPMLSSARQRAYAAQCASNLRQWGVAMTQYLTAHNGLFPEEGAVGEAYVLDKTNAWFNALAAAVGEVSPYDRAVEFSSKQPRAGDRSLYTCPADGGERSTGDEYSDFYSSYSYNLWIDHDVDKPEENERAREHGAQSGFGELLRLSQILKPARFVVLADGKGTPNCVSYHLAYRHPKTTANLLFADGHVAAYEQSVIYVSQSETDWKKKNKGGIIWDPEGNPPQTDASF